MTERCGLVSPFWVRLGWVQWAGTGQKEPLMNIEYRRCTKPATEPVERDGLEFRLCLGHAEEVCE